MREQTPDTLLINHSITNYLRMKLHFSSVQIYATRAYMRFFKQVLSLKIAVILHCKNNYLSHKLLSGIFRKLDPQNLYLDTRIIFLTQAVKEILNMNSGGHLGLQDGWLILYTSKWYNQTVWPLKPLPRHVSNLDINADIDWNRNP